MLACGVFPWQDPEFEDLLAGHPIARAAAEKGVPLGMWKVKNFYPQDSWASLYQASLRLFRVHGVTLHKAESPKTGDTYYKTFAASKVPCSCR